MAPKADTDKVRQAARHLRPILLEMQARLDAICKALPALKLRLTSRTFRLLTDGVIRPLAMFVRRYKEMLSAMRKTGSLPLSELREQGAAMRGRLNLLFVGFELFADELEAGGVVWG